MVFADTSALLALLSPTDLRHARAADCFAKVKRSAIELASTSYVILETHALVECRLGRVAARSFHEDLEPLLDIYWVDAPLHQAGMDVWLQAKRRLSLVDAVSFVVMRREGIEAAWSYDSDFEAEGFSLLE